MDKLEQAREAREYVARYGGRCRDCADHDGICPSSGLPCVLDERNKAIDYVIKALNYGVEHGYLAALSLPVEGVKGELVAWPKERANIPDPNHLGARIVGFRIREGDEAWGTHGLSEPLFWLERMCALANPEAEARLRERVECVEHWQKWATEWAGSAFIADEKLPVDGMTEAEHKTALYSGLCKLMNHMMWLHNELTGPAEARLAQAERVPAVTEAMRKAADIAYRVCAETRHISLGDKCREAILQAALQQSAAGEEGKP